MRIIGTICALILINSPACPQEAKAESGSGGFNRARDLLLAQYDCKTDVDDLHSVAAFATVLARPDYTDINYYAVAGTYGIQDGLYVPPNKLFTKAFGNRWSDAHTDLPKALREVTVLVQQTLDNEGDIWIAEAGQSDFTAALLEKLLEIHPEIDTAARIHVVQHSDWNEEVTSPIKLQYVKDFTDYHKIPDGNVPGNGTPGFRSEGKIEWKSAIAEPGLLEIWDLALSLGNQFNGKDGRYLNEAISDGGLDFSDTCEISWILGFADISDAGEFFEAFGQ